MKTNNNEKAKSKKKHIDFFLIVIKTDYVLSVRQQAAEPRNVTK